MQELQMSCPHSPLTANPELISPKHRLRIPHFRVYRRRRLKPVPARHLSIRCQFPSFENLFNSVASHNLISSALGFASASAAALSFSSLRRNSPPSDVGEWILFSSPTPFNRFVLLRCPSISFEGNELLEDVNERLVTEERHFVAINTGRIYMKLSGGNDWGGTNSEAKLLEHQRVCVGTEDGGVISLDWPANLDLKEERGLDTTLLLVPGTAQGSMDEDVKAFVCEALHRGFFPVVMNPRGCAGSPLTTARLFTAADSDDIHRATQFISKVRPWTTLMGVGWGFGANMLTKYLAEVGERTPLTAATCINNPFDLEEATRSFPYRTAMDEKLTSGLKDILRSNKALFQGRAKGFDVEKALSAETVRNFDKAISMVSYGFEAIEEFYSKSSTRDMVGSLKIPVLFIQNDDGSAPVFSIPRSEITENPYTSLLLSSSSGGAGNKSALSWCHHLTVEWLAAVELGLLKGRHPLLEDIDISINPSKGFSLVEDKASHQNSEGDELLEFTKSSRSNRYALGTIDRMLEGGHTAGSYIFQSSQDPQSETDGAKEVEVAEDGALQQTSSGNPEFIKGEEDSSMETERGQVLQSAQVVMNMLDITLPDVLTEDRKQKVLTAMSQGENLVKALQDAVPEEVCGQLTASVSAILQAQGAKLKLDRIRNISQIPALSPNLKSKNEEDVEGILSTEGSQNNHISADLMQKNGNLSSHSSYDNQQKSDNAQVLEAGHSSDKSDSKYEAQMQDTVEPENSHDFEGSSKERAFNQEIPNRAEKASRSEEVITDDYIANFKSNTADAATKDLTEQKNVASAKTTDEVQSSSGLFSEPQTMEKESTEEQKSENKSEQPVLDPKMHNTPEPSAPSFSVSQALDALTGIDDSTQVAVNSVFGVLEEMITQLEEGPDNEDGGKEDKVEHKEVGSSSQKHHINQDSDASIHHEESSALRQNDAERGSKVEEPAQAFTEEVNGSGKNQKEKNDMKTQLVNSSLLDGYPDRVRRVVSIPFYATSKPYEECIRNEYIRRYLLSRAPERSLDMDTTAALLLDYIPEEGHWKLLENPGGSRDSTEASQVDNNGTFQAHISRKVPQNENTIDPPYIVLRTDKIHSPVNGYEAVDKMDKEADIDDRGADQLKHFIRKIIFNCLSTEVDRKINLQEVRGIESNLIRDFELVGNAVYSAIAHDKEIALGWKARHQSVDRFYAKLGTLHGDHIVTAVSSAVQETDYLRKILPTGLVVGSCLAALREFFYVITVQNSVRSESEYKEASKTRENNYAKHDLREASVLKNSGNPNLVELNPHQTDQQPDEKPKGSISDDLPHDEEQNEQKEGAGNNGKVMAGVVTAALGTTALFVHQQGLEEGDESVRSSSKSFKEGAAIQKELMEASLGKDQNNLVSSLAEKAISVAAPVVPTREDGGVDQERLVAMLAEVGQRGGMLKLVGKMALLWGGLRGAMSFTDKLISFLRIAERPLIQRIIAFIFMALVLWSPVVVPLFPTLVKCWMSKSSSKMAELACIVGLYAAVMILLMLWGKRIRGYEKPFEQYGLDLTSPQKIQDLSKGLVAGVLLVVTIQYVNVSLGYVGFTRPESLPSASLDAVTKIKTYGIMLVLVGQGIVTAAAIALVEELLFRSWLPEEIATDLGYHWGIFLSGLAFSLSQRPLWAIPGLWLWSLSLAGLRRINGGSLSVPIGLRTGIIASSHILQTGGFVTYYRPNLLPLWITGTQPFQPFSGVVGLTFSLLLAVILYPRGLAKKKKLSKSIRD